MRLARGFPCHMLYFSGGEISRQIVSIFHSLADSSDSSFGKD